MKKRRAQNKSGKTSRKEAPVVNDIRFNDIVRSTVDIHTGRRHYWAHSKRSGACIGVRDGKCTFWILSGVFEASGDFTTDLANIELVRRPSEDNKEVELKGPFKNTEQPPA